MNALESVNELMDLMVEDRKFEAIRLYRLIAGTANGYAPGLMEGKNRIDALMEKPVTDRWASLQEEFAAYIKSDQERHEDFWSPEAYAKRYADNRDQALAAIMKKMGWGFSQADEFLSDVEFCVPELYFIFPGAQA